MGLMLAAIGALAAGAIAGLFLAVRHLLRKRMPAWAALLHGLGGATGFTLVLMTVVREPAFQPARQALYLFIATIALGVVNLLFHIRKVRHRTSLIAMHALTAVTGVATLIYATVVHEPVSAATAARQAPTATVAAKPPPPADSAPEASSSAPAASATATAVSATATQALPAEAPSPPAATSASPEPSPAPAARPSIATIALDPAVQRVLAKSIDFGTKSAVVAQESMAALNEIAAVLKEHPEIDLVEVQGHADQRGDDASNIELTFARASAVVGFLVTKGIEQKRLHAAGYGARCPADPECRQREAPASCRDPSRWQENRRVVFLPLRAGTTEFHGEVVCERGSTLIPPLDRGFHNTGP